MIGANLRAANLSDAILREADLSKAHIGWTTLGNVDLSAVKGLITISHEGPSTIGIDTAARYRRSFFEVAASPTHSFLTLDLSSASQSTSILASSATQPKTKSSPPGFIAIFKATEYAAGLHSRIWPGQKTHEQIDQAIRLHDKLLVILSEASMGSDWVNFEITKARQREKRDKTRILFPLGLAGFAEVEGWQSAHAVEISEYFIPDFSNWKLKRNALLVEMYRSPQRENGSTGALR